MTAMHDDWQWFRRHRWVLVSGYMWLIRLYLGTVEKGGMNPFTHRRDDPYPLAGTLATCLIWVIVALAGICLAYEAKRYRRNHPRRPRKLRLLDIR